MFLDANHKLQVVSTAAKTTLDSSVIVCWEDANQATIDKGSQISTTNGTTAVDIAFSSSGGIDRTIKSIQLHNHDSAAKTFTFSMVENGVAYPLIDVTLQVDDNISYTDGQGWYVLDASGNRKTTSTISGIISTSPSTGIGYGTGAGATVTQITNRSTGVTINAVCGKIQTDTTSLAAGASAEFTVTNSAVAIGDVVVVSQRSGSSTVAGVAGTLIVEVVTVAAGSFILSLNNNSSTTAETGAVVINFAVIKATTA